MAEAPERLWLWPAEPEDGVDKFVSFPDQPYPSGSTEYIRAEKAEAELAAAQQREAGLLEALTPSGDTKAAYMGEIKDPDTKRMVSWTAIKMVMAMVSARAALSHGGRGGDLPDAVDPPCTDCDDTGITHQTERFCSCGAGIAAAHNGRGE